MTELARPVSTADLDEVLRLTAPAVWSGLRGQRLFVTGGTGFVGKWLLECLLHADREMALGLTLAVLTRDPDGFARTCPHLAQARALELVKGDVADFAFPGQGFSSVIHAALPVMPSPQAGGTLQRLAERGARRVCEFAAANKATRLLHISSGAVYGPQDAAEPVAEEQPWDATHAVNDYTQAKRLAESVAGQAWPFDVVVARCFAFVGPYLHGASGSAAAQFIEQAARGEGIVVQGTGDAVRAYQYAADMTRWLLTSLILGVPGQAYNVGGDEPVTIAELARKVTRVAGTEIPVKIVGKPSPGLAGAWYVPDLRRASNELGLTNAVDLEEGIRRTLCWQVAA